MGHEIYQYVYPESVDKKKVQAELDEMVSHRTFKEGGGHGLDQPIRWLEYVCEDRESAEEYIREHDKGWYDQLAVKFRQIDSKAALPKSLTDLRARRNEISNKLYTAQKTVAVKDFKAQLVTCKKCGSKLNKDYLNSNFCPLCRNDMRSDTTKANIARLQKQIDELDGKIREAETKLAKKGTVCWLVKIEYHT